MVAFAHSKHRHASGKQKLQALSCPHIINLPLEQAEDCALAVAVWMSDWKALAWAAAIACAQLLLACVKNSMVDVLGLQANSR